VELTILLHSAERGYCYVERSGRCQWLVDFFFPTFLHLCIADVVLTDMMQCGLLMVLAVAASPIFWNPLLRWETIGASMVV